MTMVEALPGGRITTSYRGGIIGFIGSLIVTLLALVDMRRGFLLDAYQVRTAYLVYDPIHLLALAAGVLGMLASHRALVASERHFPGRPRQVRRLTGVLFALLVIDLFTYRGVPAARSIEAGRIGADWLQAFGVSGWWKPFAQATSYFLNVWHATMLGILISGLAMTALPLSLKPYCARRGFSGSLTGALFALPQPFCSCCSSIMAPSLVRGGASTHFLLSFVVAAPMLNITTLALAVALLPAEFALARIIGGLVVALLVTHVIARFADSWDAPPAIAAKSADERRRRWSLLGLHDLDRFVSRPASAPDTPASLFSAWLYTSGRLALVVVPAVWMSSVVASAVFLMLPAAFGNNLPSVLLTAVAGTLFMISTWAEIPMALGLIQSGAPGPAAALLVVLPAISLPCMVILGASLRRVRTIALLAAAVSIVGIAAGVMFL